MARQESNPLIVLAFVLVSSLSVFGQGVTAERKQEADRLLSEGRDLMNEGKIEEAVARFTQVRKLNPFDVMAPFHLAECEVRGAQKGGDRNWASRAFAYLRDAIRVDPDFGGTYYLWGTIGARLEDNRAAVFGFGNAHRLGYRLTDSRVGLASGLLFLGEELALTGAADPAEVVGMLEDARERLLLLKEDSRFDAKTRESFHDMWISAMTQLAGMYQRVDRMEEAEQILVRLVALEPGDHLHHFNLGKLYGSAKSARRFDEALAEYEKALELAGDPEWLEPHPMIASIYSQRGKKQRAEKHFRIYVDARPEDWGALHRFAEHHARFGEFDEAVAGFKRCLELAPAITGIMERLAAILLEAGQEEEAEMWLGLYKTLTSSLQR